MDATILLATILHLCQLVSKTVFQSIVSLALATNIQLVR